ncbi:MAG: hypothetical protein O3A19_00560 [Planctomycetota bacterium]|nr:hypothetical protein [Planctomycetota bacterium]MDA1024894.1 hypothetical protein [Planctomycetota bacterium]
MTSPRNHEEGDGVRGRIFLLIFIGIFGVSVIATYWYGVRVVNSVKAQARTSDAALRTTGYAILVAASEDGAFPMGADRILEITLPAVVPGPLGVSEGTAWPVDLATAMAGLEAMSVPEALEMVLISWPPEGDLPPVLSVGGRPSGLTEGGTTLDFINGWLRAAASRLGE